MGIGCGYGASSRLSRRWCYGHGSDLVCARFFRTRLATLSADDITGTLDPLHTSLVPMVEMWVSTCLVLSLFLSTLPQGILKGSRPGVRSVHVTGAFQFPQIGGFCARLINVHHLLL